jgi:hypothetical protein
MSNINFVDGQTGSVKSIKATGAGTDEDPFILTIGGITLGDVTIEALTDAELRASPVPMSAAALPLPTGAATDAALTGRIGEVQASPTANTLLDRLKALLTGIVLAAGSNAIGKLAANSGVDIGDVDVTSLPALAAGENVIGLVGSPDIVVTVTPTCDTSQYASGDLLFDSAEVANAVRANGGHALLVSATIIDKADQKAAFTLLFANANTDFGTPNSAPDPDDTEVATVIGFTKIETTDYLDLGGASVACVKGIGIELKAGASTTSLYIAAVNGTGTPTYGASDLVLQLGFMRS